MRTAAFAVRAAAPLVAIRTRAMALVIAPLVAGRAASCRVTALIEIAATLESAAIAGFTAADIATSTRGLVPALETTALGLVTPAPESPTVTATVGGVLAAESATVAGTATLEPAASAGVAGGPIPAPRIVAALSALTPAFEATAFVRVLRALVPTALRRPTSPCGSAVSPGLVPTLESAALRRVTPAPEAATVTTAIAGVLAAEPAALTRTATLVVIAAASATVEPSGIVPALEIAAFGGAVSPAGASRPFAPREAAALSGLASAMESTAASACVRVVVSSAGSRVGSAAPEGLPIVVLFRHGAPFLGVAKVCSPTNSITYLRWGAGTASLSELHQVLKRR
nr:hypothetical protein [Nocardia sp. CY41]